LYLAQKNLTTTMKKTIQFSLILAFLLALTESKAQTLLYYWHFDSLGTVAASSPINSDSTTMSAPGTVSWEFQPGAPTTTALIIDLLSDDSCTINVQGSAVANQYIGNALRPRNPSEYAQLVFSIPTTGYQGITVAFATEASASGILGQIIDYSADGGTTFDTTGVIVTSPFGASPSGLAYVDTVGNVTATSNAVGWHLVTADLTTATAVNNASNLIVRIRYEGSGVKNTSGGNDRFDNVTVWGTASVTGVTNASAADAGYSLYPNPTATNVINLSAPTSGSKSITVYNVTGQLVYTTTVSGQQSTLTIDNLSQGMYYVNIGDNGANYSIKFAKN